MTYQMQQREPLLDRYWQRALERRGIELIGLALLAAGSTLGVVLGTYSAADPGLYTATDEPVRNLLGPKGAAVASPLIISIGFAAWSIVCFLSVWGIRFILHFGTDRFLDRLIFFPIAVAACALFFANHEISTVWPHHFGQGGMIGDTLLGILLYTWPGELEMGLQALKIGSGTTLAILLLVTAGVTIRELKAIPAAIVSASFWRRSRGGETGTQDASIEEQDNTDESATTDGPRRSSRIAKLLASVTERSRDIEEPVLSLGTASSRAMDARDPDKDKPAGSGLLRRLQAGDQVNNQEKGDEVNPKVGKAPCHLSNISKAEPPLTRATIPLFDEVAPAGRKETEASQKPLVSPATRKPLKPSLKAKAERMPSFRLGGESPKYAGPPIDLLQDAIEIISWSQSSTALEENARMLESTLDDYGVRGQIESVRPGPVVTLYELAPAPGLKASRVIGLSDDIARSMSALSARISTVPGRSVIGIELPNIARETVYLKEIISSSEFGDSKMKLPIALGKDIGGDPVVVDLTAMPHLLIAGTTGSGKSVAVNTMILSLLYQMSPEECRLIMVDPKMLELSVYDGIPHLLAPVVTDPKKAVVALKWVVAEMEERYRKMSRMGVRNIAGYNARMGEALKKGENLTRTTQTGFDEESGDPVFETEEIEPETLPFIVVIVDEMADLMMMAGKDIEACVQRLAQMARASGIHLVMATQRPSVDVITGTIKANLPTRISFQVTSKVDSRTILGEQGAEQLLGMGDMLYMEGGGRICRVHGPFVSDEEVEEVVKFLKSTGQPQYVAEVVAGVSSDKENDIDLILGLGGNTSSNDAEYDSAVAIVLRDRKCSTSYIQRKMEIGYNKAARLVERMEEEGLVSPANHVGRRSILVPE